MRTDQSDVENREAIFGDDMSFVWFVAWCVSVSCVVVCVGSGSRGGIGHGSGAAWVGSAAQGRRLVMGRYVCLFSDGGASMSLCEQLSFVRGGSSR